LIHNSKEYIFEGIVNGYISNEPKGNMGFGYDPIFVAEGYQKTFAELTLDEKSQISHRSRAFSLLRNFYSK
jgi:XTP/dITP diphosphohydrolase